MGDQANLSRSEASKKIRDIAEGEVCMFHTVDEQGHDVARPMATSSVDEHGSIWFMTRENSVKCAQLRATARVKLTYSVSSRSEYLSLECDAMLVRDRAKIEELWTPLAKTWFPDGKDDPEITLIRADPRAGHYWDTKHNKMVQLAGMLVGAVTGKETDDGIEGELRP